MSRNNENMNDSFSGIVAVIVSILTIAMVVIIGIAVYNTVLSKNENVDLQSEVQHEDNVNDTDSQDNVDTDDEKMNSQIASLEGERKTDILLKTSKGDISLAVYPDLMPITVDNFVNLIKSNFYNGLTFHRVEDWVIQGGDPNGDGSGGSGNNIKLETNEKLNNVRGAIAMARSTDPDSASSQFYILKSDASWLDGDYAVYGMVQSGMDVVDSMAIGDTIESITVVE